MANKKVKKTEEEKPKLSAKEVEALIVKLGKESMPIAKIGQILKDTHGVLSVRKITGKKIKEILEANKLKAEIPEDLNNLIKRAGYLKKHLEKNKQDRTAERGLLLAESNLRELGKYYVKKGILPKNWRY